MNKNDLRATIGDEFRNRGERLPVNFSKPRRKGNDISKKIVSQNLTRIRQDVRRWREANLSAEIEGSYNRTELYRLYKDVVLDSHMAAVMQSRTLKAISKPFQYVTPTGELDEKTSEIFKADWFIRLLKLACEAKFYGHSLIQFGDIEDDKFTEVSLIPREYVKPELHIVTAHPAEVNGVNYLTNPNFKDWVLPVGESHDLGLLLIASPYILFKKNSFSFWSEYQEVFGMPTRILYTDDTSDGDDENSSRAEMEDMLINAASRHWGIFDTDDRLEFIQASGTGGNAVYETMIDQVDKQISKLVLGQTMTTDQGSSRSQAEVHENTETEIIKADLYALEVLVNNELLPRMRNLGFTIPEGKFEFETKEKVSASQKFERVIALVDTGKYKVSEEFIEEQFGVPVEQIESVGGDFVGKSEAVSATALQSFTDSINDFYENKCDHVHNDFLPSVSDGFRNPLGKDDYDRILEGIFSGHITIFSLDAETYRKVSERLVNGYKSEFGSDPEELSRRNPKRELFEDVHDNIYTFAAAKSYQETLQLVSVLRDANGNIRSFSEFKKEAVKILDTFNKHHLRTEYNSTIATSLTSQEWIQIQEDKEQFLQYQIEYRDGNKRPE